MASSRGVLHCRDSGRANGDRRVAIHDQLRFHARFGSLAGTVRLVPRFAAIDVGSNASRLVIVDARDPKKTTVFRNARVAVRLGHSVFQTGRLAPEAIDQCVAAMKDFAIAMDEAGVDAYRAIATASARGASNADVLFERIRDEAGIELGAVDGLEEARLVTLAVRQRMTLVGHVLLADLGGGSLELSEADGGTTGFSTSLPIGTVRLLEAFFERGGRVDDDHEELVREYLERVLAPHVKRLKARPWKSLVGTGGNFEVIAKLCPVPRAKSPTILISAARALLREMKPLTSAERMARWGLREDRADVIVPALYVVDALAKLTRAERIVVPGVGLKDGIVRELIEKHFRVWDYGSVDDALFGTALALGRRYHFDERHAMQVATLASSVFDATTKLHGYGPKQRNRLRLAALLHDVGDFVHPSSHHKHTAYIIQNSDFMGLDEKSRGIVATVARYHRKSAPTLRHPEFRSLDEADRREVRVLAGILRIGDALDRGHKSKVDGLTVRVRSKKVLVHVVAAEDASLEAWTLTGKAELFEQTLGCSVILDLDHPHMSPDAPIPKKKRASKAAPKKRTTKRR